MWLRWPKTSYLAVLVYEFKHFAHCITLFGIKMLVYKYKIKILLSKEFKNYVVKGNYWNIQ